MTDKIDIVMVAYNEVECIEKVLHLFYSEVSQYADVQLIVAEDGSTDGTRDILRRLENELPLKLVLADERRGYDGAVRDVLMATSSDTILFVDSDGQYLPEDFQSLLNAWNEKNNDMIMGEKVKRQDPPHRILISWFFHLLVRFWFRVPFKDMDCGYRFIKRELALTVAPECHLLPYSYWSEFTVRAYRKGFKISTVPIRHRDRLAGESRMYPVMKLPAMALKQLKGLWILSRELRHIL